MNIKSRDKVLRDVEIVKKCARIVIILNHSGVKEIIERTSQEARLNVIAIVGPVENDDFKREEVILLEIGIGRARPYNTALKPIRFKKEDKGRHIQSRKKLFCLTERQYRKVAPYIFSFIAKETVNQLNGWIFQDGTYPIKVNDHYFTNRSKKPSSIEKEVLTINGKRFSVSKKDLFLLSDVYWAELSINTILDNQIEELVNYIDKMLNYFANTRKWKNSEREYIVFENIKNMIEDMGYLKVYDNKSNHQLAKYLAFEILNRAKKKKWLKMFEDKLREIFELGNEIPKQHLIASQALLGQKERLSGIHLRVKREKDDYIVFELYAPRTVEAYFSAQ